MSAQSALKRSALEFVVEGRRIHGSYRLRMYNRIATGGKTVCVCVSVYNGKMRKRSREARREKN